MQTIQQFFASFSTAFAKQTPTVRISLAGGMLFVFCCLCSIPITILGRNLPILSNTRYESVTGNPLAYPEDVTYADMLESPATPVNDITLKIKYPVQMSLGETVPLFVTCVNNSSQPIDNLRVVIWGKPSMGLDANYFEGINVSSSDTQFIDSGFQVEGLFAYFDTGLIGPGKTQEMSVNIAANNVGGYRGEIHLSLDIPGKSLTGYDAKFLTTVTND